MTYEELRKALKEGKSVAQKDSDRYLRLLNGKLVAYLKDGDDNVRTYDPYFVFNGWDILNDETGCEIYKRPILSKAEKKYLSEILDPLKNFFKAILITKFDAYYSDEAEYIVISFIDDKNDCSDWRFSPFKKGTKYAMLREGRAYELEELGL